MAGMAGDVEGARTQRKMLIFVCPSGWLIARQARSPVPCSAFTVHGLKLISCGNFYRAVAGHWRGNPPGQSLLTRGPHWRGGGGGWQVSKRDVVAESQPACVPGNWPCAGRGGEAGGEMSRLTPSRPG
jgi:hypothetical protein